MSVNSIAYSNIAALCNRTTQQVNHMSSLSIGAALAAVLLSTAWAAAAGSPPGRMQAKFDRVERKTNSNHTSLPRHGQVSTSRSAKKPASQLDNDGDKYPPTDLFSGMDRF
ncbi:hypothetical protein [Mesorhizobium sangaii]|uniref:Uncharacterized protein n=1 Tax=Mesorhizobium sangaii TaxID=505389 RepID=A0A841PRX1_9HYPH|nr:hypothetical protein [Mesorhizobium sangaii]MBB6412822.1 hypothetical protein [Mesorhizobium sangaii]